MKVLVGNLDDDECDAEYKKNYIKSFMNAKYSKNNFHADGIFSFIEKYTATIVTIFRYPIAETVVVHKKV